MADFLCTMSVALGWAIVVNALIRGEPERQLLWLSFALHQVSAIAMVLMTRDYYEGGDMLGYAAFGTMVSARLKDDFFGWFPALLGVIFRRPDPLPLPIPLLGGASESMEGFAALVMFVTGDSLYAGCALVAGATFLAKMAIYRVMKAELPGIPPTRLLIATVLLPSAVFWSSGILKEPIAVVGIGMMCLGGHTFVAKRERLVGVAWLGAGTLLVGLVKAYILPPFGLAAGLWYYLRSLQRKRGEGFVLRAGYGLVALAIVLGVVLIVGALVPEFSPAQVADEAVRKQDVGAQVEGGSNYSLGDASGSPAGQAALAPLALLTALFRPVLFEISSPLMAFGALEMAIVTVFFVRAFLVSPTRSFREILQRPALAFCAVFTLTMGIGVGLGSTNLGSLSRYRMPMLPFFGTLLLALTAARRTSVTPAISGIPVGRVAGSRAA